MNSLVKRIVETRQAAAVVERQGARRWNKRHPGPKMVGKNNLNTSTVNSRVRRIVETRQTAALVERQEAREWVKSLLSRRLPSHVNELSSDVVKDLHVMREIGKGKNGIVSLIRQEGELRAMKVLKDADFEILLEEIQMLRKVNGAGGAPVLHGVCIDPFIIIQSYVGMPYEKYLSRCPPNKVLFSLVKLGERLSEIHQKNLSHNDLKINNVAVTLLPGGEADIHIIDFGECSEFGMPLDEQYSAKEDMRIYWVAPEVKRGGVITRASDVFSFGHIIHKIYSEFTSFNDSVKTRLLDLYLSATKVDPEVRLSLDDLIGHLTELAHQNQ
ncbi:tyrosine protein-kinase src-1-like [Homarus americanus]|uniref:tyrosine protein-kinase src-1-like n=1 Tax=Homarus americanus TaxID=6706 RepID=UPI001C4928AC|nr:tyrosine protein-kinase src-1-like [Homarus americanus]